MLNTRVALLVLAVAWIGLATPALATPRCTKTCRRETASCARTRCATLRGQPRKDCLETCRGIGGCGSIGTLAYVVSTCTDNGFHQKLQIRHRDCDPITLLDFPEPVKVPKGLGNCEGIGNARVGAVTGPMFGAFQRLGVSPDGRYVAVEVTDDFTVLTILTGATVHLVPPEQQEGIFLVRTDGRGVPHWLAPASRDRAFRVVLDPAVPGGVRASGGTGLFFSPDGREVALTDLGPGPKGEEAVQIFTLDVVTGTRTQVTHLPVVADRPRGTVLQVPGTGYPFFDVNGEIVFNSGGDLDGTNPDGNFVWFRVNRDGSVKRDAPSPIALPGNRVTPIISTTGGRAGDQRFAFLEVMPGTPVDRTFDDQISEVWFHDGGPFYLQLTTFGLADTAGGLANQGAGALLVRTGDRERVVFIASADPLGTNPLGSCQLFSIGTGGAGLRQLTHFSQPGTSLGGCNGFRPGCQLTPVGLNPATETLLFYSDCDPLGTNPVGDQLFAIRADGTHLRQLTHARGLVPEADGTLSAENIGPFGYLFSNAQ